MKHDKRIIGRIKGKIRGIREWNNSLFFLSIIVSGLKLPWLHGLIWSASKPVQL